MNSRFSNLRIAVLSLLLISIFTSVFGQNDWINYNQQYFKLNVANDGMYKISASSLNDLDPQFSSIDPRNIQLFRNGIEEFIYIHGEQDGTLDPGDYIEFYGRKNDGSLETSLYRSPEDQSHSFYSIFTDTSSYYITWSTTPSNKRILDFYDNNYAGKNTDPYFQHEKTTLYTSIFFPGIPISGDANRLYSEYTGGEGFYRQANSALLRTFVSLEGLYSDGPDTEISALGYTANNNTTIIVNGKNHEFGLAVKDRQNLLTSKTAVGYERIELSANYPSKDLDSVTAFFLGEVSFSGSLINLSFLKVKYPRIFDLQNNSELLVESNLNSNYVNFSNYPSNLSSPFVFDLLNNRKIRVDKLSDNSIEFNLPNNGNSKFIIYDDTDIKEVSDIKAIPLVSYQKSQNTNYLIITNKILTEGAEEYKAYRESPAGGQYNVEIVYVNDLYHSHGYGVSGPQSIVSFLKDVHKTYPELEDILLLGKGQSYARIRNNSALKSALDLVPSIGFPESDYLYVSSLDMTQLKHNYAIGRIPARNNDQIRNYLEKLREFESQPNQSWQKKIIQLAGGTISENITFRRYLAAYFEIIEKEHFGGYRKLFSKSEPVPVQTSLTEGIINEINSGSSMISYFGHGAAQVTEIDLGKPYQYDNFGRTPIFFFNGCALGSTFEDKSLAEDFLFEPKKGALGWIASTSLGYSTPLFSHTREIHKALFNETYGRGIGSAIKLASERYGSVTSPLSVLEHRQLVYHGDPALDIFAWDQPDFIITQANTTSKVEDEENIFLNFTLTNNGKYFNDSVVLSINIRSSTGEHLYSSSLKVIGNQRELEYQTPINRSNLTGLIKFEITIDSTNLIEEIQPNGELNNSYIFSSFIEDLAPTILRPSLNSIVPNSNFEFLIQIPGDSGISRILEYQLDSTPYFNTPIDQGTFTTTKTLFSDIISGLNLPSTDYYLRFRYNVNGNLSEWTSTTFGYIPNDSPGWTEGDIRKFHSTPRKQLEVDTISRNILFGRTISRDYKIVTTGAGLGRWQERYIVINGTPAIINWWPITGVSMMVINPNNDIRYSEDQNSFNLAYPDPWWIPSEPSEFTVVGNPSGVYNYNTDITKNQDSLIAFLDRIPDGYHLVMISTYTSKLSLWKPELWDAFEKFGVSELKNIGDGEPFGIYGTKGMVAGEADEKFGDYTDAINPPIKQRLEVSKQFTPFLTSGSISSRQIGPSTGWETLTVDFENLDTDKSYFEIKVFGRNESSTNFIQLLSVANEPQLDLSSIDANKYPFIFFTVMYVDDQDFTPQNIKRWKINYQETSEGVVNKDLNHSFMSDTVLRGEDITYQISFTNIRSDTFKASTYFVALNNGLEELDTLEVGVINDINPLQSFTLSDTLTTTHLSGNHSLVVGFNSDQTVREEHYFNNFYSQPFFVRQEEVHPILDVVFDGRHILDYDLVSPFVEITASVSDENPFLLLDDADRITMVLTHPNGEIEQVSVDQENVRFIPPVSANESAKLIYSSKDLASGEYQLNVTVTDNSGNRSSQSGYTINFVVEREMSITNLYPYPNPFTTSMKFVFTLTGTEIPDYMKIQIMTVSGRVVREITGDELGQIQIGNNISEFTWDGTDSYGDPLANGVYLYKVTARHKGEDIMLRETSGDQFFHNGIGKIYIVR